MNHILKLLKFKYIMLWVLFGVGCWYFNRVLVGRSIYPVSGFIHFIPVVETAELSRRHKCRDNGLYFHHSCALIVFKHCAMQLRPAVLIKECTKAARLALFRSVVTSIILSRMWIRTLLGVLFSPNLNKISFQLSISYLQSQQQFGGGPLRKWKKCVWILTHWYLTHNRHQHVFKHSVTSILEDFHTAAHSLARRSLLNSSPHPAATSLKFRPYM